MLTIKKKERQKKKKETEKQFSQSHAALVLQNVGCKNRLTFKGYTVQLKRPTNFRNETNLFGCFIRIKKVFVCHNNVVNKKK